MSQAGGRKLFSDSLDKCLKELYDEAFENRFAISRRILVLEARSIRAGLMAENPELENLKLSKGWLDRFLQRHSLTIRRTTTVSQRTPADFVEKVCNFVLFTRQLIADQKLTPGTVYGMDETAVWLDPSASTSIATVGVCSVPTAHYILSHTVTIFSTVLST